MHNLSLICSILLLLQLSCSDKPSLEELQRFAATEIYPEDKYLDTVSNKRALIIVAHDDDDCAMSGTIAKLTAMGWEIKQLSLVKHSKNDGSNENPAGIICLGNEAIVADGQYRIGLDTMKTPYLPIPYNEIEQQFLSDKVAASLIYKINTFNPSVLFTLDNIKGGYGHPEHVFISQLVLDLMNTDKIAVERIYQSVYTDHMEKEIVDIWLTARLEKYGFPNTSTIANKVYGINGMPEPDVQIDIIDHATTKMNYLRAYPESVKKNLRKFLPYYEEFSPEAYFNIFDREFFRILVKSRKPDNTL